MNEILDELLRQRDFVSEQNEDDKEYKKLYSEVESALKLRELIKKKINMYKELQKHHPYPQQIQEFINDFEFLMEKSGK